MTCRIENCNATFLLWERSDSASCGCWSSQAIHDTYNIETATQQWCLTLCRKFIDGLLLERLVFRKVQDYAWRTLPRKPITIAQTCATGRRSAGQCRMDAVTVKKYEKWYSAEGMCAKTLFRKLEQRWHRGNRDAMVQTVWICMIQGDIVMHWGTVYYRANRSAKIQ